MAALLAEQKTAEPYDELLRFVPISHGFNRAVGCHSPGDCAVASWTGLRSGR